MVKVCNIVFYNTQNITFIQKSNRKSRRRKRNNKDRVWGFSETLIAVTIFSSYPYSNIMGEQKKNQGKNIILLQNNIQPVTQTA